MTPQPGGDRSKGRSPLLPREVGIDLTRLNHSYLEMTGKKFEHYHCPFTNSDDPVELCMGHVVPQSYPGSCRARVAQRKDIDNFYGSVAEADFGTLLAARGKNPHELLYDKRMQREVRPRVRVDGADVPYYPGHGGKDPAHTRVILESASDGRKVDLVLKLSPDVMLASLDKRWDVAIERDCRLTAMVTLIKAAYLTMFHQHAYQWALSAAGVDLGYFMLGAFFRANNGKPIEEVRRAMKPFFLPFKNMVRPVDRFVGDDPPRGTIEDHRCGICFGSSGKPFAQIVYVRLGDTCHGVLLPGAENPESAAAYWDFLNSDNESLRISNTWFNQEEQQWEYHPEARVTHWPKKHVTFDFD